MQCFPHSILEKFKYGGKICLVIKEIYLFPDHTELSVYCLSNLFIACFIYRELYTFNAQLKKKNHIIRASVADEWMKNEHRNGEEMTIPELFRNHQCTDSVLLSMFSQQQQWCQAPEGMRISLLHPFNTF